jgi:hypothetical protein
MGCCYLAGLDLLFPSGYDMIASKKENGNSAS